MSYHRHTAGDSGRLKAQGTSRTSKLTVQTQNGGDSTVKDGRWVTIAESQIGLQLQGPELISRGTGFNESKVRTVSENAQTLKFEQSDFEAE